MYAVLEKANTLETTARFKPIFACSNSVESEIF